MSPGFFVAVSAGSFPTPQPWDTGGSLLTTHGGSFCLFDGVTSHESPISSRDCLGGSALGAGWPPCFGRRSRWRTGSLSICQGAIRSPAVGGSRRGVRGDVDGAGTRPRRLRQGSILPQRGGAVQQDRFREAQGHFDQYRSQPTGGEFHRQALFRAADCILGEQPEEAATPDGSVHRNLRQRSAQRSCIGLSRPLGVASRGGRRSGIAFPQITTGFSPAASFRTIAGWAWLEALESLGNRDEAERYYLALGGQEERPIGRRGPIPRSARSITPAPVTAANDRGLLHPGTTRPIPGPQCRGRGLGAGQVGRHAEAAAVFSPSKTAASGNRSPLLGWTLPQGAIKWIWRQGVLATVDRLSARPRLENAAARKPAASIFQGHARRTLLPRRRIAVGSRAAVGRRHESLRRAAVRRSTIPGSTTSAALSSIAATAEGLLAAQSRELRFLGPLPRQRLAPRCCGCRQAQLEQNHCSEAEATLRRLDDVGAEKKASDLFLLGMAHEGQRRFAAAIEPLEAYLQTCRPGQPAPGHWPCWRSAALPGAAVSTMPGAATTRRLPRRASRITGAERACRSIRPNRLPRPRSRRASSKPRRRSASGCSTKSQIRASAAVPWWDWPGAAFTRRTTRKRTRRCLPL